VIVGVVLLLGWLIVALLEKNCCVCKCLQVFAIVNLTNKNTPWCGRRKKLLKTSVNTLLVWEKEETPKNFKGRTLNFLLKLNNQKPQHSWWVTASVGEGRNS